MRILPLSLALSLSLPLLAAGPALANPYHDDWQPPAAIALFSATGFSGEVREAFDPLGTLHEIAFNDRARSVAVLAGQWELCEHINFTGRCVFIREDVADLGWFGLNNRVTSIRPIFEYTEALHGLMFTRDDYGYIRYAHNESYGYNAWNYGYSSSVHISVRHYGFSSDYLRFGYYDPRWGYDPYGFAWSYGGPRYVSYVYRVHPRPIVINNYWRSNWHDRHPHWDRRSHRDDWRRRHDWRDDGRRSDYGRGRGDGRDDRGRRGDDDRGSGRYVGSGAGRDAGRGPGFGSGRMDPGRPRASDDRSQRSGTGNLEAAVPAIDPRDIAAQPGRRGGVSGERARGSFEGRPERGNRPDGAAQEGRGRDALRPGQVGVARTGGGLGLEAGNQDGRRPFAEAPAPDASAAPAPRQSFEPRPGVQGNGRIWPGGSRTDGLLGGPGAGPGRPEGGHMRGRDGSTARSGGLRREGDRVAAPQPPSMSAVISSPPPAPPPGRSGWDGGNRSGYGGGGQSPSFSPPVSAPPPAAVSVPSPPPGIDPGAGRRGPGGGDRERRGRSLD